ncbi:mannose-1-phosphate guanylyltransferase [Salegentibacter sp. HM20]
MTNKNYYAILMAGGVGSRFWPMSTQAHPKQFHDILGTGRSLLQHTFSRLQKIIPPENIYILTNAEYVDLVKEHLPGTKEEQIVAEPAMRNTAPAILLGAMKIRKKNRDALILVAPSDHWIKGEDLFSETIKTAFSCVENEDKLITLGVKPTNPNTGYGYIKFDPEDAAEIKEVEQFTEKPFLEKAKEFLEAGNYVWNAGIFVWSASYILECFKEYLPEMYRLFEKGQELLNTAEEQNFLDANYAQANNISIDYGILEKAENVYVIPVEFQWNDLGTWGSLERELGQDEQANTVVNARLLSQDASGNIISTASGKVVVLEGLEDYIVVESEDVLMVVPKSKEQSIKELREKTLERYGKNLG